MVTNKGIRGEGKEDSLFLEFISIFFDHQLWETEPPPPHHHSKQSGKLPQLLRMRMVFNEISKIAIVVVSRNYQLQKHYKTHVTYHFRRNVAELQEKACFKEEEEFSNIFLGENLSLSYCLHGKNWLTKIINIPELFSIQIYLIYYKFYPQTKNMFN